MADTWEDAIKERIRKYFDPDSNEEELESNKIAPNKYDRKYFDNFDKEREQFRNKNK